VGRCCTGTLFSLKFVLKSMSVNFFEAVSHYVAHAVLKHAISLASCVLGLQLCATMLAKSTDFLKYPNNNVSSYC
jgi:hypothetical protein